MLSALDVGRGRGPYRTQEPKPDDPEPTIVTRHSVWKVVGLPAALFGTFAATICVAHALQEPQKRSTKATLLWQQAERCIVGEGTLPDEEAFRAMQLVQAGLSPAPGAKGWPASCAAPLHDLQKQCGVDNQAIDELARALEAPSASLKPVAQLAEGLAAGRVLWTRDRGSRDAEDNVVNTPQDPPYVGSDTLADPGALYFGTEVALHDDGNYELRFPSPGSSRDVHSRVCEFRKGTTNIHCVNKPHGTVEPEDKWGRPLFGSVDELRTVSGCMFDCHRPLWRPMPRVLSDVPVAIAPIARSDGCLSHDEQLAWLNDQLLVVWATSSAGLRFRMAPAHAFGTTRDRILFDDWRSDNGRLSQTQSSLIKFRLFVRSSFALVLIETESGVHPLRIEGDGRVLQPKVNIVDESIHEDDR